MKIVVSSLYLAFLLAGCYGSIPPEPPCLERTGPDSALVEVRIERTMSRRPRRVWHVRRDSTGSWIPHGRDIHYFLNGQASAIEWYRDGKRDGAASFWHENGAKQGEIAYHDGLAEGLARTWYDDGRIELERTWVHGKLDGIERRWDRRGNLVQEIVWKDNRKLESRTPTP